MAVTAHARIDNRDELISLLSDELSTRYSTLPITSSELILAGYERWGEEVASHLLGDFTFAVWDEDHRRLYCARDPMGVRCIYYTRCSEGFAFATEIRALLALPWVRAEIDETRVSQHLSFEFEDVGRTFFRGIRRLPAANWLIVGHERNELRRYWDPGWLPTRKLKDDREYEEAFRELFLKSVQNRLCGQYPVGSTLSGGLDSSSICCAARQIGLDLGREPLQTFSLVFPGLSGGERRRIDERYFAEVVLAKGQLEPRLLNGSLLGPLDDLESICKWIDSPSVPFNLYLHVAMYRAANADGVRILLDGFDGDTILSYGYGRFVELARRCRWIALIREARAFAERVPNPTFTTWRVLRNYAIRPQVPPLYRRLVRWGRSLQNRDHGSLELRAPEFAARSEVRLESSKREAALSDSYHSAREEHLLSLRSPLIPWSLEIADQVAGRLSLDLRFPFFDRRLVEFCVGLPSEQKLRDGWTRWILRRSLDGLLPPQVQWRFDKADLAPNFHAGMCARKGKVLRRMVARQPHEVWEFASREVVDRELEDYLSRGGEDRAMRIFAVLSLGVWLRQWIGD